MKELQRHVFGHFMLLSFVFVLCSAIPLFVEFVFAKTVFHRFFVQNNLFVFKTSERIVATVLFAVLVFLAFDIIETALSKNETVIECSDKVDALGPLLWKIPFLYLPIRNIVVVFTGKPSLVADVLSILFIAYCHMSFGKKFLSKTKLGN